MNILLIGYGAIGCYVARNLASSDPSINIGWVLCREGRNEAATQALGSGVTPVNSVDEIAQHALNFKDPGWPEQPKVLVPGCGTGYHPLILARRHPEADVLAVDLSRTSLAYAIRKQEELKITNVRFCQADLLCLGELSDRFEAGAHAALGQRRGDEGRRRERPRPSDHAQGRRPASQHSR